MQKKNTNVKILFIVLLHIGMVLACNYATLESTGKVIESSELCYTADRSEYVDAADKVGQVVEIPQYPESAEYQVCHISGKVSSVRMIDGHPPEDDEELNTIPAGTYIGTIEYPDSWNDYLKGESATNEVTIQVMDDGTMEGSFSIIFVGPHESFDYGDVTCTGYFETEMYGSFEKPISGSAGVVTVTENWDCRNFYDCSEMSTTCFDGRQYDFEVDVSGEQMQGKPILPDVDLDSVWTFKAAKE